MANGTETQQQDPVAAFRALSEPQQKQALSKMSPAAKQSLLTRIKSQPPPTPKDTRSAWQQQGQAGIESFAKAAGVPESPSQIPAVVKGMLLPQGDPQHPTTGEKIPILGPVLTAQQQVLDQPGAWAKIFGSIPLIGPPAYAGAEALDRGDYWSAAGSVANIALQMLGMKPKAVAAGSAEASMKAAAGTPKVQVPYSPDAAVKPSTGLVGAPKGITGRTLASRLGLRPDLENTISTKVDEIQGSRADLAQKTEAARQQSAAHTKAVQQSAQKSTQAVQESTAQAVTHEQKAAQFSRDIVAQMRDQVTKKLEVQMGDVAEKRTSAGEQLVRDTAKAAWEEKERVSAPFAAIAEKIPGTVADGQQIKSIIRDSVTELGVNASEIPEAAYRAIGKKGQETPIMFQGSSYLPSQLPESIRAVLKPEETGSLTFGDLTRIREDVYGAAAGAKDRQVKRGLYQAAEKITDLQEKVATDHGLGVPYGIAKRNYMNFRRGIGSGIVDKWLAAGDMKEQAIAPKLAKLTNKATEEALTSILGSVGIDVGSFKALGGLSEEIPEQMKAVTKEAQEATKQITAGEKGRVSELEVGGKEAISGIEKTATQSIAEGRKTAAEQIRTSRKGSEQTIKEAQKVGGKVVPGKTTEELAGKDNVELNRMRLKVMSDQAKSKGILNPMALFQIVYGLSILAHSPIWGGVHLLFGIGRSGGLDSLLNDATFQNWVLQKSGVIKGSPADAALRQGLVRWGKTLTPASSRGATNTPPPQSN